MIWCLQHEALVPPAAVAPWCEQRGHDLTVIRVDRGETLPDVNAGDLVVVLGGSMNVGDAAAHQWLTSEAAWINSCVRRDDVAILGICLGAQLIASVLGAEVGPAPSPERGWQMVYRDGGHDLLPPEIELFQAHGQVFALPDGAARLAHNDCWHTQAFSWGASTIAVQFHPEFTHDIVAAMAARHTSWTGPWVQPPATWLDRPARFVAQHQVLGRILDLLSGAVRQRASASTAG